MRIPKICILHANAVKLQGFDGKKKENVFVSQPTLTAVSIDKCKKDSVFLGKKK